MPDRPRPAQGRGRGRGKGAWGRRKERKEEGKKEKRKRGKEEEGKKKKRKRGKEEEGKEKKRERRKKTARGSAARLRPVFFFYLQQWESLFSPGETLFRGKPPSGRFWWHQPPIKWFGKVIGMLMGGPLE